MANPQTNLTITHAIDAIGTIKAKYLKPTDGHEEAIALSNLFAALAGHQRNGSITAQVTSGDQVAASGTLTVASGVATDTSVVGPTTFTCVDHRDTTNVTFGADVAGSLNNKWFSFQDQPGTHKYYVWFNINSAGTDPTPAGHGTGIVVAGATGASAATLATAAVTACASVVGLKVSAGASGHIITTNTAPGAATATADGTASSTGFTFTHTITGSALTSAQYQVYATDTLTAADLVRAINANTTSLQYVSAANLAGVVTVTCLVTGVIGNAIILQATGNVTANHATLTSGAAPVTVYNNSYHCGL